MRRVIYSDSRFLLLIPVFGTIVFIVLYVIATFFYPGGSQIDRNSIGFSWSDNYWCNLLDDNAINGQINLAKPIAIAGATVLSLAFSVFWFTFPRHINTSRWLKIVIQITGILAMIVALLLFTEINHDHVTNLAALCGIIATIGSFIGLYKAKWFGLFVFGLLNVLLVGLNNYTYYTKELILYLPVVQKITFVTFMIWICSINICLYRLVRKR